MVERELYAKLSRGAEADGWALYHISDAGTGRKPFDMGGVSPYGEAVGLEVKAWERIQWNKPLPWQRFEASQRGWLKAYAKAGALALIALCERDRPETIYLVRLLLSDFSEGDNRPTLGGHRLLTPLTLDPKIQGYRGWNLKPR